jgi:hypothetical protein
MAKSISLKNKIKGSLDMHFQNGCQAAVERAKISIWTIFLNTSDLEVQ